MPILHDHIIIKEPQWRATVEAVIARGTARGAPIPPDLPPGGSLALVKSYLHWRVQYRIKKGSLILLGSATAEGRSELRLRYLADHPITLESGRQVIVTFDDANPDLVRPVPVEVFRQFHAAPA